MHIIRIDLQEIARLPPNFNDAQMLSEDKIIDILFFGTPKSYACRANLTLRSEFSENNATATGDSNPPPLKKIMANRTTEPEPTQAL